MLYCFSKKKKSLMYTKPVTLIMKLNSHSARNIWNMRSLWSQNTLNNVKQKDNFILQYFKIWNTTKRSCTTKYLALANLSWSSLDRKERMIWWRVSIWVTVKKKKILQILMIHSSWATLSKFTISLFNFLLLILCWMILLSSS